MARKHRPFPRCGRCKLMRESWETWYGGFCPACRDFYAKKRHRKAGARALAGAHDGGTLEREGQTFRVVVIPSKRRSRRAA